MFLIFDDQKVDGVKSMYTASPKLRQITPSSKGYDKNPFFFSWYITEIPCVDQVKSIHSL